MSEVHRDHSRNLAGPLRIGECHTVGRLPKRQWRWTERRDRIFEMEIIHRTIHTNGIEMHVAEAGEGPLVLLLHGFPELWYSFRHQLGALAGCGYRAVAPDLRGYGATDAPSAVHEY